VVLLATVLHAQGSTPRADTFRTSTDDVSLFTSMKDHTNLEVDDCQSEFIPFSIGTLFELTPFFVVIFRRLSTMSIRWAEHTSPDKVNAQIP